MGRCFSQRCKRPGAGGCCSLLTVGSVVPKKDVENVSLPATEGRERQSEQHRGMLTGSRAFTVSSGSRLWSMNFQK